MPVASVAMSVTAWILMGLVAGGIARRVVGAEKRGCLGTIVIGVLGALLGGTIFRLAGGRGVGSGFWWSTFVALIGASLLLIVLERVGPRDD